MSKIDYSDQRVAVFIDTQNLYHSARNLYEGYVNFVRVIEDVVGDRKLIRAIAYVISSEKGDEQAFFDALQAAGIELRIKDLQVFAGGAKKADWDVGMAFDALSISSKVDAIVLITGDGDFVPLVEYLKIKEGIHTEAATFSQSASQRLIDSVDVFYDLAENPGRYLLGKGRGKK